MISTEPACYTTIQLASDSEPPTELKLKEDLENGDMKTKIEALKRTITLILNGEKMPSLLMTIIRFVLPLQVINDRNLKCFFLENQSFLVTFLLISSCCVSITRTTR